MKQRVIETPMCCVMHNQRVALQKKNQDKGALTVKLHVLCREEKRCTHLQGVKDADRFDAPPAVARTQC